MRRLVPVLLTCSIITAFGCQAGGGGGATVEPKTEDQKTLYAIGLSISSRMSAFALKPDEVNYVVQGLRDGLTTGKKPLVELSVYGPKINELQKARAAVKLGEEKTAADAFLATAAKDTGAETLPSGLIYKSIKEGTGDSPKATDKVTVHYHGTLRDGTVFDSSRERKTPASFPLNGVIPCWTEGVQKMKVGGQAKLVCPSKIAYGDQGRPPKIPGGAALVFEVELISIDAPGAPGAPGASMPGAPGMHGMQPLPPGIHPGMNMGGANPGIRPMQPALPGAPGAHPGMPMGQHPPVTAPSSSTPPPSSK